MGGGEGEIELESQGLCDIDNTNTIFVAVGKNVKESKSTLLWAVKSFPRKKICLLHVHEPAHLVTLLDGKFSANKLKQQAVQACRELEQQKMHKLLNRYLLILAQVGVQAGTVWMELDDVEKGIVQIISQHDIRWLVMGAAADKHYSKKLSEPKSKKATFVSQQAPVSCHIWFICNGCLIYTRYDVGSIMTLSSSTSSSGTNLLHCHEDADEDTDELVGMSRGFTSQVLVQLPKSTDTVVGTLELNPLSMDEIKGDDSPLSSLDKSQGQLDCSTSIILLAEELEISCTKEKKPSKEMEEVLSRQRQELERMKNQHDQYTKELQIIRDQKPVLESQLIDSHSVEKELEEKIIQAVKLLVTFKEKRDKLQIEREKAIKEINGLRKLVDEDAANLQKLQFFAFSFSEIGEATRDFDPSWKIGDGIYGSVYKGILRHLKVAIKMLPSCGSQCHVEFEHKAWVLSKVRHPHLVTLIGTCPESKSLIYEYLGNGSLEDHFACQGKTPLLSWQTRIKIASEICSVLIFLHSSRPCIIHGNLKPTNILLDDNFVSKLSDLSVYRLIPQDENRTYMTTLYDKIAPEGSVYMDPQFLETGELTAESDVYSFGIVLLRLLTGRPALGVVKDVKCALERDNFNTVLDHSAGEWPLEEVKTLARLALRCCENKPEDRPNLVSEVQSVIVLMRELSTSSNLDSKGPRRIPSHFVCPIFQEVMKDPHIAADGFTYEADAIKGWLNSGHNTSPMTNLKLDHCDLLPNYALYYAIQEWLQNS
ncbi:U-box domain-containing protein 33 [Camellia lanceoleosa]|uniref:U-box domain-containing protein 33 n=1 Tax=Camellia lanceoleosa TaxID=1840588 RepID=A0ACC0J099_9ERIC|nr:U-box domain-containing protein 33 [Camellia lanceoleosa]